MKGSGHGQESGNIPLDRMVEQGALLLRVLMHARIRAPRETDVCPGATGKYKMATLTSLDRIELGRMVINVLDGWGVGGADQVTMLAFPEGTPARKLQRYLDDTPLPDDPVILKRVEHLLGIADALRTTFPLNANIGLLWLKQPCKRLRKRRPIEIMVEDGLNGLITVRTHLDCSFAWRESERKD